MALFALDEWRDEVEDPNEMDIEEYESKNTEAFKQMMKEGELYVTKGFVDVYEQPDEPSPIRYVLPPGKIILLAAFSHDFGGFRDVIFPDRGWIFPKLLDADRAYLRMAKQMKPRIDRSKSSTMIQNFKHKIKRRVTATKQNNNKNTDPMVTGQATNATAADSSGKIQITVDDVHPLTQHHGIVPPSPVVHQHHHAPPVQGHSHLHTIHSGMTPEMALAAIGSSAASPDVGIDSNTGNSSKIDRVDTAHSQFTSGFGKSNTLSMRDAGSEHNPWNELQQWITYTPAKIARVVKPMSKQLFEIEQDDKNPDSIVKNDFELLMTQCCGDVNLYKPVKKRMIKCLSKSFGLQVFIRKHPSLLLLPSIMSMAVKEGFVYADLVTDIIVAVELLNDNRVELFVVMSILIFSPYYAAWSSSFHFLDKQREFWGDLTKYKIFLTLFSITPIGVLFLLLFDTHIAIECCIIRPLYWLLTQKLLRNDTFEESGYKKLRRVSELCTEKVFQAILQLIVLILVATESNSDVNEISIVLVAISFALSLYKVHSVLSRITKEAKENGLTRYEYLPIVLQGSFKFVPKLAAIERGTVNGTRVNWTKVELDSNGLSGIMKAVESPACSLNFIKVWSFFFTTYSICNPICVEMFDNFF